MTTPQFPITVRGSSGASISFDGWTVTVHHRGGGRGLGDASVPISQVSGVELRRAGWMSAGLFTVLTAGAVAPKRAGMVNRNPLSVWLTRGRNREFGALRDTILRAVAAQHAAPPQHYPPAAPSITDELQRLGQMAQQGLLSPQQFEQAKQQLLGGPRY
jgi:hypothetical protein